MSRKEKISRNEKIFYTVSINLEDITKEQQPSPIYVHAFDSTGKYFTSAAMEKNQVTLSLPPETAEQTMRLLIGPKTETQETVKYAALSRAGAYEKRVRIDPKNPKLEITIKKPIWILWLFCPCVIRGRVVRKLTLPDGTVKDMPLCNTRVTICEVDRIPKIILKLPDVTIFKLRDDLINILKQRPRIPDLVVYPKPPIPPIPEALPIPLPDPFLDMSKTAPPTMYKQTQSHIQVNAQPLNLQMSDFEIKTRIEAIANAQSATEIRKELLLITDIIKLFICNWPWFDRFFWYTANCFRTVTVDENGRFETTIWYPCLGDKPDLYFKAEQLHSGVWEDIYSPPIRCNTYWNYECGTEVTLYVTNPSAIPCVPEDPVETPEGITTWVMPYAVGGTEIWGTPPGMPPAPAGWVKTNGKTDYSGIVDAPFGNRPNQRIGLRHGASNDIPNANIKYYRWSYRKTGDSQWKPLTTPVFKHYVKQSPGHLPTFPAYKLGPNTVGTNGNLFEFKPSTPPGPEPTDPAGTITYWPIDSYLGDIYSGFLDTSTLPPNVAEAAGQYQFKLEVFNPAGNKVNPSGAFKFIVPTGTASDGVTILTREAQATPIEIDNGAFIFNLWIDNNPTSAVIDLARIGATSIADKCGFLLYNPTSTTPVSIGFHALHPNNFAIFNFRITRGSTILTNATVSGEAGATAITPYNGDGVGNFMHNFARAELLCGPFDPTDCCINAAFALTLRVWGKATNGWTRIGYDAFTSIGFALAPQP
jgi:hypothetical protein